MKLLLFPFKIVLGLVEFIFKLTGRLFAVILGLVFLVLGGLLCLTVVGAIIGAPLGILGFVLIIKGLF